MITDAPERVKLLCKPIENLGRRGGLDYVWLEEVINPGIKILNNSRIARNFLMKLCQFFMETF